MTECSEYRTITLSIHSLTPYLALCALTTALIMALALLYTLNKSNNTLRHCITLQSRTIDVQRQNIELMEVVDATRVAMVEELRGQIADWRELVEGREQADGDGPPPYEEPTSDLVRQQRAE